MGNLLIPILPLELSEKVIFKFRFLTDFGSLPIELGVLIEQHRYQIVLYKGNWLEEKERKENGVLALVVGRKVLSSLELINYSTQLSKQNTKKSIKQTL